MTIFLIGPPGIGKTLVAQELAKLGALHLEVDAFRARIGATTTTNPVVEDAINWQVYCAAVQAMRTNKTTVVDSTGASKRYPYLRTAIQGWQQVVLLTSAFPYAACARKWGSSYSQEQFNYILSKILEVKADITYSIDVHRPVQIAQDIWTRYDL